MATIQVTVGTDGNKNWVQTPDGQKFSLGRVSVLSFVSKLTSLREARRALDAFVQEGSSQIKVDDDRMWDMLAPRKPRWAAVEGSFMSLDQHMDLSSIVEKLERVANYCSRTASAGKAVNPKAISDLVRLASDAQGAMAQEQERTYSANYELVESILDQTSKAASALVGRPSDMARTAALRDVARVTSKVASICEQSSLTESWVGGELKKLSARSTELCNLFHSEG